jgi:hypothetical protein
MKELSGEDLEQAATLVDANQFDELLTFVSEKIPNHEQIIDDAVVAGLTDYQNAVIAHSK